MFVKTFKLHLSPHTIAVFISMYLGEKKQIQNENQNQSKFIILIDVVLKILVWPYEITDTYI